MSAISSMFYNMKTSQEIKALFNELPIGVQNNFWVNFL